jgi:simple sugar transport system ATP-binding protein
VGELSGGNQQKVAIGRGVASEPSVLMVSEPTRGIDVRAKDMVLSALGSIADEGVGVVVVSGEVLELERICDRIIVLRDGRVKAEFSPPFSEIDIELAVLGESAEALA